MEIDYTPEQKKLRRELRAYFRDLFTPELFEEIAHSEGGGPAYMKALGKMGADGWLGIGWPKESGGMGRSAIDQFIFFDEVQRAGFPIPFLTLCTVGPTLIQFGTDAQREKFISPILAGRCHFSIGYTEPEAGTDLASLRTRAVRDGDHYVVNGQKVFTSLALHADYIWLACRTDPDAPKHKGISILIVDTKLPGVEIRPTRTLGGDVTTSTFYENVRVPVDCLVGKENEGWRLITTQLNHERVSLVAPGALLRFVGEVRDWARATKLPDGRRVIDLPWVQSNLARVVAKIELLTLMHWRQAADIDAGFLNPADASAVKVFGSELYIEAYRALMEILGQGSTVIAGSPGALLQGKIERLYRSLLVLTFGGGTNEIQRSIIAMAGCMMPRSMV